jgi:hypothetical protein
MLDHRSLDDVSLHENEGFGTRRATEAIAIARRSRESLQRASVISGEYEKVARPASNSTAGPAWLFRSATSERNPADFRGHHAAARAGFRLARTLPQVLVDPGPCTRKARRREKRRRRGKCRGDASVTLKSRAPARVSPHAWHGRRALVRKSLAVAIEPFSEPIVRTRAECDNPIAQVPPHRRDAFLIHELSPSRPDHTGSRAAEASASAA